MRTVVNTREVAHLWASQSQVSARNANSSVFFHASTIYSYGNHFPMGKIITHKGTRYVLLTTRSYSVTTSRHQSQVAQASRHLTQFYVADVHASHAENLKNYRNRIQDAANKVVKARTHKQWEINGLDRLINTANGYATTFGLKSRFTYPKGFDIAAEQAKATTANERRQLLDDNKRRIRLQKDRDTYTQRLTVYNVAKDQWLAGESVHLPAFPFNPDNPEPDAPIYLRVRGTRIETSLGAVVSVDAAKRLLNRVRGVITDLPSVDGYQTTDVQPDKVTVGCHVISTAEIERIATQLGL